MSTPPGEATQARRPAGRENIFTRRIGPLPTWAWVGIGAAIILAYAWYRNRAKPAASSSGTNASQVPQFVNQTYTTVMPPSTPKPPVDKDEDKDKDDEDRDKDDRHKKRPPRRRHPTHDRDKDRDKDNDRPTVPSRVGSRSPVPARRV